MIEQRSPSGQLLEMFAGLVENAFYGEIGLADPELVAYLAALLARFVHVDEIYPSSRWTGRRIEGIAQMLEELPLRPELPQGPRPAGGGLALERSIHRHVGDFTLFWSGLFPEVVRFNAARIGGPRDAVLDYASRGKRSYLTASRLTRPGAPPPPRELLQRLSTHYELCARAMNIVRRGLRPERVSFNGRRELASGRGAGPS